MTEHRESLKLGLAFAVGVSLSAGYVALGQLHGHAPEVVVVEERCPGQGGETSDAARASALAIELAPLAGDTLIPEGLGLWLGRDGLWLREAELERPLARLDEGRFVAGDLDRGQIPALSEALATVHSERTAVLWVDHRVPGATIASVLASLRDAGFDDYAFVVAGDAGEARAYRFGPAAIAEPPGGTDVGLELSLRLVDADRSAGGVAAWIRPQLDGRPRVGSNAQPLDLGEAADAGAGACMLAGQGLPDGQQLAALEAELCALGRGHERGRLNVEYGLAASRTIGELLGLRAGIASTTSCRVRSTIAAPEPAAGDCTAALSAAEMISYLDDEAGKTSSSVRAEFRGLLDKDTIRAVVRANIADIRTCYNLGLAKDPALAGRVVIEFVIAEDGQVTSSEVGGTTQIADADVASCMAEAIGGWKFPSPSKGEVVVTYPFLLEPG